MARKVSFTQLMRCCYNGIAELYNYLLLIFSRNVNKKQTEEAFYSNIIKVTFVFRLSVSPLLHVAHLCWENHTLQTLCPFTVSSCLLSDDRGYPHLNTSLLRFLKFPESSAVNVYVCDSKSWSSHTQLTQQNRLASVSLENDLKLNPNTFKKGN